MIKALFVYLLLISLVAVIMTCYDKAAARQGRRRISEAALMRVGAFGGAAAMYATMQTIRHKTQHPKFMRGLPLMILGHAVLLFFILR